MKVKFSALGALETHLHACTCRDQVNRSPSGTVVSLIMSIYCRTGGYVYYNQTAGPGPIRKFGRDSLSPSVQLVLMLSARVASLMSA